MKASIKLFLIYILMQLLGSLAAVPLVLVWQFVTTGSLDAGAADAQTLLPGSLLALFFSVWYLWKKGYLDDYRQYAPTSAGYLGWTALLLVGSSILMEWLMGFMDFLPDWQEDVFGQMMDSWAGVLTICLLAPVVEELMFRGAITRELLRRYSPGVAIVVSGFFFGLIHFNPVQSVYAFMLGLLLAWLYWRTRSLVPGIVFHVLNNSIATWMTLQYPDADNTGDLLGADAYAAVVCGAAIVFAFALWRLTRYPKTGEAGWLPLPQDSTQTDERR